MALVLEPMLEAKGKERQREAGENFGKGLANENEKQLSQKSVEAIDTKKELAGIANVSHDNHNILLVIF